MDKTIKLFSQVFKIIYVNQDEISNCFGEKTVYNSTIKIADHLSGHERISMLLHEVSHQILRQTGAEHKIADSDIEYICDLFSFSLATIILDNPDFLEILKASDVNRE